MYTYRDAQGSDFETICLFPQNEEELFHMFPRASFPLMAKELEACASERIEPTVFLSDGKLAGYANIIKLEEGNFGSVGNIIVALPHRGKGLGKYILDVMSDKLRTGYSAQEIRLACFSTNISGLMLYQRYGFVTYDMETRVDNRGNSVALLHLRKEL